MFAVKFEVSLILSALCLILSATEVSAQGASQYHVFPQFVDGDVQQGTFYRSTLFVTNATATNALCNYQLYGMPNERLLPTNSFTLLANGGVIRATTRGSGAPLADAYATLSCDQPVYSFVQYELVSSTSGVTGTASIYSASPGLASEFIFPTTSGYRLGIAIANDSVNSMQLNLRLGAPDSHELDATITVGPRSKIARFVDEIFSIPCGFCSGRSAAAIPLVRRLYHSTLSV